LKELLHILQGSDHFHLGIDDWGWHERDRFILNLNWETIHPLGSFQARNLYEKEILLIFSYNLSFSRICGVGWGQKNDASFGGS